MIRWMCGVSTEDDVSSDSLLVKMGLDDIETLLRKRRLRWAGHVERSTAWIKRVGDIVVADEGRGRGRPKKTWGDAVREDREALGLLQVNPSDRLVWRGRLRSSVKQDPPLFTRD